MVKTLQRLLSLARGLQLRDLVSLLLWAFTIVVFEGIGRGLSSEFGDGILVVVLSCLIGITAVIHRARPIAWIQWMVGIVRKVMPGPRWLDLEIGVDLRGTPTIPRAIPPLFWKPTAILGALSLLLLLVASDLPAGLRLGIAPYAYTVYLAVLGLLWTALVGGLVLFIGLSFCLIHDEFVRSRLEPAKRSMQGESTTYVLFIGCALLGAILLPPWSPAVLIGVLLGIPAIFLAATRSRRAVSFLWRSPTAGGPTRSLRWQDSLAVESFLSLAFATTLGLATRGDGLWSERSDTIDPTMPITSLLGLLFLWGVALSSTVVSLVVFRAIRLQRAFARADTHPFLVRVLGPRGAKRRAVEKTLRRANIRLASSRSRARTVDLELTLESGTMDAPVDPFAQLDEALRDSRRVSIPRQIDGSVDIERIRRLAGRSHRRRILTALAVCFRLAGRHQFKNGTGFWIGIQHWFAPGVTRDESDPTTDLKRDTLIDDSIGIRFSRVVHPRARAHLLEVTRALDVGLMFVEDGVQFSGVQRVLETIFEQYDIHAGQRRIEDRDFVGIPGIRVVLHEFDMENPFRSEVYPEPDYEDIGRGRILHIFKDRSDELEFLDVPFDVENLSPSLG